MSDSCIRCYCNVWSILKTNFLLLGIEVGFMNIFIQPSVSICIIIFDGQSHRNEISGSKEMHIFNISLRNLLTCLPFLLSLIQAIIKLLNFYKYKSFFLSFNLLFYWSIVDLKCCINFCYIAKWLSYTYI